MPRNLLRLSLSPTRSSSLSVFRSLSCRLSFLFCYFSFCASINFTAAPSCHVSPTFSYGFRFSHNVSFIWFWFSLATPPELPKPPTTHISSHRRDFDTAKLEHSAPLQDLLWHIHLHTQTHTQNPSYTPTAIRLEAEAHPPSPYTSAAPVPASASAPAPVTASASAQAAAAPVP